MRKECLSRNQMTYKQYDKLRRDMENGVDSVQPVEAIPAKPATKKNAPVCATAPSTGETVCL